MEEAGELHSELEFMQKMQAYRRARESGDPEAIQRAEDAWREQVRQEMIESENCSS